MDIHSTQPSTLRLISLCSIVALAATTACSTPSVEPATDPSGDASSAPTETPAPPPASDTISGMFDVGGRSLFMECTGTGEPTIVFLHGAVNSPEQDRSAGGYPLKDRLDDDYRFCDYDRRNVGRSDTIDEVQHVDDAIGDLHNLLEAAGIEPPVVLLGGSFGGTLASIYANTYPDDVAGMVLIDSMFGDLILAEELEPPETRFEAYHEEDQTLPERISHFEVLTHALELAGSEPEIPMTFLASTLEPIETQGSPEWNTAVPGLREAFVARYSPGELIFVDAPHYMEPVIPDQMVDVIRDVVSKAGF